MWDAVHTTTTWLCVKILDVMACKFQLVNIVLKKNKYIVCTEVEELKNEQNSQTLSEQPETCLFACSNKEQELFFESPSV